MGSCFSKSKQQNSENENAPPRENINRPVEVAPPAKKDDGDGAKKGAAAGQSDKKDEKKEDKGDEKKEDKGEEKKEGNKKEEKKELAEGGGQGGAASTAMVVANKMEHSGYPYAVAPSMPYWYDSALRVHKHNKYVMEAWEHQALFNQHNMPCIEHYPPHLIGYTGM